MNDTSLSLFPKDKERSLYKSAMLIAQKSGPTAEAANLLQKAHRNGDPRATYAIATWYLHGSYFKKDLEKGVKLLQKLKTSNIPEAIFDLAYSYEIGLGAKKSPEKSFEYYVRSALLGDGQAIKEVIRCLYWGKGIKSNRNLAFLLEDLIDASLTKLLKGTNRGQSPRQR